MTIETDRVMICLMGRRQSHVEWRLDVVKRAVERGATRADRGVALFALFEIFSPSGLLETGAQRIVIDTFAIGDGSRGGRTAKSPFRRAQPIMTGETTISPISLYHQLNIAS